MAYYEESEDGKADAEVEAEVFVGAIPLLLPLLIYGLWRIRKQKG